MFEKIPLFLFRILQLSIQQAAISRFTFFLNSVNSKRIFITQFTRVVLIACTFRSKNYRFPISIARTANAQNTWNVQIRNSDDVYIPDFDGNRNLNSTNFYNVKRLKLDGISFWQLLIAGGIAYKSDGYFRSSSGARERTDQVADGRQAKPCDVRFS